MFPEPPQNVVVAAVNVPAVGVPVHNGGYSFHETSSIKILLAEAVGPKHVPLKMM